MNLYDTVGRMIYRNKTDDLEESLRRAFKRDCLRDLSLLGYSVENVNFNCYNPYFLSCDFVNCNLMSITKGTFADCTFTDCVINFDNHGMLAQILFEEARTMAQKMVAGFVLISLDKCWDNFLRIRHPERKWALTTLANYVRPDDNSPAMLQKYR